MKRTVLFASIALLFLAGCSHKEDDKIYHSFADHIWYRWNILQFEVPVEKGDQPFNVVFFTYHTMDYPYDSLSFNMVMTAPSGEERIRECTIRIRDQKGQFTGTFLGDSCERKIILSREMVFTKEGFLRIELENLVPRPRTPGLCGVGIRLEKP